MAFQKPKGIDILFYFVIAYVMVAGGWWSYLLYIKNEDALSSKKKVLWYQMKEQGKNENTYLESPEYTRLTEQYSRQKWMIFSESSVLLLLMVFGIWRISKSRQKELALAQQQRNFLLSITHELKSPIAVIKLTLDTFNKRTLNQEQIKMLTTNALSDTERLNKLVEDLLLAARVDGGYQYVYEELDLEHLIKECVQIAQSKYNGVIELHNKSSQKIIKKADKNMLTSVMLNLLENAVKYAPNTAQILVNLNQNKDNILIDIIDFGQGIPKQERERIFDKFYRIGNEDTRKSQGTGLGLYIVKQVLLAHKGNINVHDNEQNGSVFSIILPKD